MSYPAKPFWSHVVATHTGCWEWQAARFQSGYGAVTRNRKTLKAHRVAWMLANGPIPDGLLVLHRCDNKPCVRPDHLFLGTQLDNQRDMAAKGRGATGYRNGRRTHPETTARGEAVASAKLSADQVRQIRAAMDSGLVSTTWLAGHYGIHPSTIRRIVRGETWKSVA